MGVVDLLYLWTDRVLIALLVVLRVWAIVDCATRKAPAFPAVDKLTKPAWLAILIICAVIGTLLNLAGGSVIGILSLITTVPVCVYLADVRPAVREISGGR